MRQQWALTGGGASVEGLEDVNGFPAPLILRGLASLVFFLAFGSFCGLDCDGLAGC